jgi:uncharacterized protein (DUF433 family)
MYTDEAHRGNQTETSQTTPSKFQSHPRKSKKKKYMKSRILSNPNVCGGEPFIKGTRIPVQIILTHLSSGDDDKIILENFPKLRKEDIEACREYAERRSRKRFSH